MNTNRSKTDSRTIRWHRHGKLWYLVVGGIAVARIVQHPQGYLARIGRHDALGWDCVDFASLAQAKAGLRHWWAIRRTAWAEARYYGLWGR
jgi:hypothetical protein